MNISAGYLNKLQAKGKVPSSEKPLATLLRIIANKLDDLIKKPEDKVIVPEINLPKPPKKWRFEVRKDSEGRTTEIIATAIE